MTHEQPDTFERSCEHWSDAARDEMEAFYELARVDYRYLAEAYDWARAFRSLAAQGQELRLIDVACGSGKFPEALCAYAGLDNLNVRCGLLDPSDFSIRETKRALAPPFQADEEFCCTLQDWEPVPGRYQLAWATHALYCVPPDELEEGLERMCRALAPGGLGFVAQGLRDGHYVGVYDHYRAAFLDNEATPYSDGAQVESALRNLGMAVSSRVIEYTTVVDASRRQLLESYLQRCTFDDTVSLDQMLKREPLATYLASCYDDDRGEYRFLQRVAMLVFSPSSESLHLLPSNTPGDD